MPLWTLLLITILHAGILTFVAQSIRNGRIERLNCDGVSREEQPVRFWYHMIMTTVATTIVAGVFYRVAYRDGIIW